MTLAVDVDLAGRRGFWQTGHCHNIPRHDNDKAGSGRQFYIPYINGKSGRTAKLSRVVG